MSNPKTSIEAGVELQAIAMRLNCALRYAPGEGHNIPKDILDLNAALGIALHACDAASLREIPV